MDTGVREILVKALNQSAEQNRLGATWMPIFLRVVANHKGTLIYAPDSKSVSGELIACIEQEYTPAEILSILAVARFEGIWRPE